VVKSWGVLPLQDSICQIFGVSGHQTNPTIIACGKQ